MIRVIRGKTYDFLKDAALIYLPAIGVLYAALAVAWHWGYVTEVGSTVLAVDTFLGATLKISSTRYNNSDEKFDGEFYTVVGGDGGQELRLKSVDYHALNTKNELTFRLIEVPASSTTLPNVSP